MLLDVTLGGSLVRFWSFFSFLFYSQVKNFSCKRQIEAWKLFVPCISHWENVSFTNMEVLPLMALTTATTTSTATTKANPIINSNISALKINQFHHHIALLLFHYRFLWELSYGRFAMKYDITWYLIFLADIRPTSDVNIDSWQPKLQIRATIVKGRGHSKIRFICRNWGSWGPMAK